MSDELDRVFREMEDYIARRLREKLAELYSEMHSLASMMSPMWHHEGYLEPLYAIKDLGTHIAIYIDLPCAEESSIDVHFIDRRRIEIRAKLRESLSFSDWSTRFSSTKFSEYRTTIALPVEVDPSRAKVRVKRGVVEIVVPKA
ncbi:MAG: Hsp20/alpha crystallin family protein [Crenarchaeota archaeon]|nr:Hsp20/alpha crystallin family protein [Thermoproteota archaeon]